MPEDFKWGDLLEVLVVILIIAGSAVSALVGWLIKRFGGQKGKSETATENQPPPARPVQEWTRPVAKPFRLETAGSGPAESPQPKSLEVPLPPLPAGQLTSPKPAPASRSTTPPSADSKRESFAAHDQRRQEEAKARRQSNLRRQPRNQVERAEDSGAEGVTKRRKRRRPSDSLAAPGTGRRDLPSEIEPGEVSPYDESISDVIDPYAQIAREHHAVVGMLTEGTAGSLRQAILLIEILGPPLALRNRDSIL